VEEQMIKTHRIARDELETWSGKVTAEGGDLGILQGSDYGLSTSIMESQIGPGSGPRRHKHPHAEIFVVNDGEGRYEVDGTVLIAAAGDVVIVPPDSWHSFTNPGPGLLRQTIVHENRRIETLFEDGSTRD
jgi:quercetin dioxygenase-like cupin family protein